MGIDMALPAGGRKPPGWGNNRAQKRREQASYSRRFSMALVISFQLVLGTLLTKKSADFNARTMGHQYVPVCSMTMQMFPPMSRSVLTSLDNPAASCST